MRTRLYLNLGLVYDSLHDAHRRRLFLRRSVYVAQRERLHDDLFRAHYNLGHVHLRAGEHSQALRCLERARDCARAMAEGEMESDCLSSTAQVGAVRGGVGGGGSGSFFGFSNGWHSVGLWGSLGSPVVVLLGPNGWPWVGPWGSLGSPMGGLGLVRGGPIGPQ